MAKKVSTSSRKGGSAAKSSGSKGKSAPKSGPKVGPKAGSKSASKRSGKGASKGGTPPKAKPSQKHAPVRAAKKPTKSSPAPIAKGTKLGKGVVGKGVRVTASAAARGLSKASGPRAKRAAAGEPLDTVSPEVLNDQVASSAAATAQVVSQEELLEQASPRDHQAAQASGQSMESLQRQRAASYNPGPKSGKDFAVEVARLVRDDKCEDVLVLDARKKQGITDFIIIASGTSDRQMRSVLHHVEELGTKTGNPMVRASIDERTTWILADFVDVMLHLFEPNTRSHYDLELMWGDCDRISWERPDQRSRDYAGLNS
jgi:ribosome-associated protein